MANNNAKAIREKLSSWLASPLGRRVIQLEQEQLEEVLPNLFGYHILQYGYPATTNFLSASKIVDKTILFLDNTEIDSNLKAIYTSAEELPIATDCIDVVVLPHILEYSKDAHKLLREMERVMIGDGHIVIIGINPLSFWGLWHLFLCWWDKMPWSGRLISLHRLKDWLSLLNFEVKKTTHFFFSPPLKNEKLLKKCLPLERLGRYCWPFFGGLYIVVAQKRTIPLNPIKMSWQKTGNMIGSGMAEPTTRDSLNH